MAILTAFDTCTDLTASPSVSNPVVHQISFSVRIAQEERRQGRLIDGGVELQDHLPAVIEDTHRPPGRSCAADAVVEVEIVQPQPRLGVARGLPGRLGLQSDEFVLRITPGDADHIGGGVGVELQMVGPAIRVDDQIGPQVAARGLDQNMGPSSLARSALRLADNPADRVAGRDRSPTRPWSTSCCPSSPEPTPRARRSTFRSASPRTGSANMT